MTDIPADMPGTEAMRVLFLCTHNSSRSQMAEGLLRARGGKRYMVFSAGTHPRAVHPLAVKAMAELGIDISEAAGHRAKGVEEFTNEPPLDLVVTVCDEAAEKCPYFPNARHQLAHRTYDRLIIATGATPVRPTLPGIYLAGVYLLRSMEESFAVNEHVRTHHPRSAVIIGGGYIGMEMADALTHRGLAVTVVEQGESVLKTVDQSLGQMVSHALQRHQIQVTTSVRVERIVPVGTQLIVMGTQGFQATADLVLVAVGIQPRTEVVKDTGMQLGLHNAIRVTRAMETSVPDIFAAGDCVETWHRLLKQPTSLPLGTTAHKQGRIAGENAVGGHQVFAGTLGTQVVKVFEVVVARTGLRDNEAAQTGFDPLTVESNSWDHKVYYPGACTLRIRVTGDRQSGRLLGAQMPLSIILHLACCQLVAYLIG